MKKGLISTIFVFLLILSSVLLASCAGRSSTSTAPEVVPSDEIRDAADPAPSLSAINVEPSFTSHDGTVRYYLPDELPASLDGYPVVTVSPHEFTVEEAQNLANILFGDAEYYEYRFDPYRPLTAEQMRENLVRWESYLNDGIIEDLLRGDINMINDYQEILGRFKDSYAAAQPAEEEYVMPPSDWSFHPFDYYLEVGYPEAEPDERIHSVVSANGLQYHFWVSNRKASDFSVNMAAAFLYNDASPNSIDERVQQYELCKSPLPTEKQLESIKARTSIILESLNLGSWEIDGCAVERMALGSEEAYTVTVNAVPVFSGIPVIRHPQLSRVRNEDENAQHYYFTSAEFTFSPNGVLITCSINSPLDITGILQSPEILSGEKLLEETKGILSGYNVLDYSLLFIPDTNRQLRAEIYFTSITEGLSRIEIENGLEYRYVPSLCFDGYIKLYDIDDNNKLIYDTSKGKIERRILVLNATDGSEINISADGRFIPLRRY